MTKTRPQNLVPDFILEQQQQGNRDGHFQAATLFVDLTGFTPLTEALMRHEKDGAEALAEALRAIFTPLVHEVYVRGGMIPLFAGDAFTAIFPVTGSNHDVFAPQIVGPQTIAKEKAAISALTCALAIQQHMAGAGSTVETRYGTFALAATAGLSFGQVQWGIPGKGETLAYYFRGAAIDNCAIAEHQAATGEVIVDPQIMELLGDQITVTQLSDSPHAAILNYMGPNTHRLTKIAPAHADVSPFIARAILDLTAPAEFREVCVVFLSFQEPATIDEMHAFIAAAMELTTTYGGIVNQLDFGDMGGYLLLLFGAPVTHEDDCERAAEFLLALRAQAWSIPWRAGVDYGTVWAGIRGGDERNEYGVAGNVVILACRLFLMAPWDAIWISHAVNNRLQARYEVHALGAKQIKGRSEPQPVYRLGNARLAMPDVTLRSALIGRSKESSQLLAWLQPIFAGHFGGVIYIDGEAGIGKSRLVGELQQTIAESHDVIWLTCPADGLLAQSLQPFRRALQGYFGVSAQDDISEQQRRFTTALDALIRQLDAQQTSDGNDKTVALARELERVRSVLATLLNIHLSNSFYEQLDPQLRFDNMLSALKTVLSALAARHPVILHLEDSHWLDDDSHQALQRLTRNVVDVPLAIVATARYHDDGTPIRFALADDVPQETLALTYLPRDGVRTYAAQILGLPLTDESANDLIKRTNGNPFFVEQLLLDLQERGRITEETINGETRYMVLEAENDSVPPTLNAVLMARLDRLHPPVKEVVQTAAVLGREFDVPVLAQMLERDTQLQQQLNAAQQEQIWMELNDTRYLFRHALLRDAAYDMQLRSRLRALHARAGQAIETLYPDTLELHYAALAYHYDRAEKMGVAARWYGLAGEYAADQYANEDAVRYLSRGLELTPEDEVETRFGLLQRRERVFDVRGDRANQEEDIQMALKLSRAIGKNAAKAAIMRRYAHFARMTGDYTNALAIVSQAVEQAKQAEDLATESSAHHTWGRTLLQQGQYDEAMGHFQHGLALAQAIGDQQLIGQNFYDMGIIHYYQADYQTARSVFEHAQIAFQQTNDQLQEGNCCDMYGVIHQRLGNYTEAQKNYAAAAAIYHEIGYQFGQIFVSGHLGDNYFDLGDYQSATTVHQQALKMCQEIGDLEGEAASLNTLTLIQLIAGNYQQARNHNQQALAIKRRLGDRRGLSFGLNYLGQIEANTDNYFSARLAYEQALNLRRELGEDALELDDLAGLARLELAQGDLAQALAYVERILTWVDTNGTDGIEFVILVYLTCYRVLQAGVEVNLATIGQAEAILRTGYELLEQRANAIQDPKLRHSFLQNVPFNREMVEAWEATVESSPTRKLLQVNQIIW